MSSIEIIKSTDLKLKNVKNTIFIVIVGLVPMERLGAAINERLGADETKTTTRRCRNELN